jgi:glutaredoxin 2
MAFGLINQQYKSVVVAYDDETTPVNLTGKKMLPILETQNGAMNESLDIIAFIDSENKLSGARDSELEAQLPILGGHVHSLAMPYWMWTPEFNEQSRRYFQAKKEEKRGPFKDLVKKRKVFIEALEIEWPKIEAHLSPFYKSETLTINDIMLAAHVWGLYVVPEYRFPDKIHEYLQRVKALCRFDYHADFW